MQRWRTTGTPTLLWSSGGFLTPKAVAVAGATVYVADSGHNRIVELSLADGHQTGTIGVGKLHETEGVAIDGAGDVWVADTGANRLVEFGPGGAVLQTFGSAGTGSAGFDSPEGLAIDAGRLYVCDTYNDRVQVYLIS